MSLLCTRWLTPRRRPVDFFSLRRSTPRTSSNESHDGTPTGFSPTPPISPLMRTAAHHQPAPLGQAYASGLPPRSQRPCRAAPCPPLPDWMPLLQLGARTRCLCKPLARSVHRARVCVWPDVQHNRATRRLLLLFILTCAAPACWAGPRSPTGRPRGPPARRPGSCRRPPPGHSTERDRAVSLHSRLHGLSMGCPWVKSMQSVETHHTQVQQRHRLRVDWSVCKSLI